MLRKSDFEAFLKRQWHWIAFSVLVISALFFLFGKGFYNFTDSGYYSPNSQIAKSYFISKLGLFSNTDGFYFGYDNSQRSFAALLITFYQFILTSVLGVSLSQIVFYFFYYFLLFFFGQKLLSILFFGKTDTSIRIGALFLAFNPVSLLLITMSSVGLTYAMFVVFCYAILCFLREGKYKYLFLSIPSGVYLFYYLRFLPFFCVLFFLMMWILWERREQLFQYRRFLALSLVFFLSASPFIVGNVLALFSGSSVLSGYQSGFQKFEEINYNFKSRFLFSLSYPGGFTPSVLSYFFNPEGRPGLDASRQGSEIYKVVQIIFNIILFGFAVLRLSSMEKKDKNKSTILLFLTLATIGVNTVGYFTNLETFNELNHSVLAFLYNDYGFLQFCQAFLMAFLLVLVINAVEREGCRNLLKSSVFVVLLFCFFNTFPYLLNRDFYGLKKINNIPDGYKQMFWDGSMSSGYEASLFVPYYWLKLAWAPHFVNVNFLNDSRYRSIIVPNFRVAGAEFITLYNDVYNHLSEDSLHNLAIFNIKSIFLFKNVEDTDTSIDAYGVREKSRKIEGYEKTLSDRMDANETSVVDGISHYRFNDADQYDFLLYSPKTIIDQPVSNFFVSSTAATNAPVYLDELDEDTPTRGDGSNIFYKWGVNNSNKYYLKIDSVSSSKEMLIQLNQMRSKGWAVYPISKTQFDSVKCKNTIVSYPLTSNKSCFYSSWPLDWKDVSYLFRKTIKAKAVGGNYFGNLFTIQKDAVEQSSDGSVYLAIFFRGQIYYEIALVVFLGVFILVGVLYIREEATHLRKQ
jgi:hypothetical protein